MEGAVSAILEESEERDQLASVADYLDACVVDEDARHKARLEEIDKLDVMFKAFTPRDRRALPKEIKVFGHCWVDKVSNGIAKSRLTCQDFKRNSNEDRNSSEGQNNFCPTPGHSTSKMLEIYSLYHNFPRVKADLTSAFLIARDQGDDKGQPVCMKPPREWLDNFEVWLATQPEEKRKELEGIPREQLVGRWMATSTGDNLLLASTETDSKRSSSTSCQRIDTTSFEDAWMDVCSGARRQSWLLYTTLTTLT